MAIHAVFTLGLRDIRYNVSYTDEPRFLSCDFKGKEDAELADYLKCDTGARPIAVQLYERLKANPDEESKRLRLPIIMPCLEYLRRNGETEHLKTILFVVTDQPEGERKRFTDTVNMAPVCTELLRASFSANPSADFRTLAVKEDPDQNVSAYRQIGRQLPLLLPQKQGDRYYMFLSGGIQSVAQALRQHGLRLYGRDWIPCQVREPRDPAVLLQGECSPVESVKALDRENPFLEDAMINTIRTLVERYDYYAAWQAWRFSPLNMSPMTDVVRPLLLHAVARFNNNLDEAYRLAPDLASDLDPASRTLPIELREIRDAAEIALKQGQVLQFIVRIATFYENGLRYLAAELTDNVAWQRAKETKPNDVLAALGRLVGPQLSRTARGNILIDRQLLKKVTETETLYNRGKSNLKNICTQLSQLDRVYDLRNSLLHRMESITEDSVKRKTGRSCKEIIGYCDKVVKTITSDREGNVYLRMNGELLGKLTFTFER